MESVNFIVSDMVIISRLPFPSLHSNSLDGYVSLGYLKILSAQFYLNE